ncbi:poly-gamma-glutamate synthesis protein (capsule biosynthesis protein) [Microbulbifer donghaiensis]|uniref:Poly-gamma-glutamate synthesis protein (Capsule biosynthesis protein) n=1 Tax=Microbulbifer donghaiensis TaxID=494016 RepID=A0A1M5DSL4_9GAMM|nr:CapA family protein [Microbulbifer donghaiensis]SHF69973.1 poly-gamma-glutamate synthesis protein (capsule biosynthesis protein) [Microbulbifer donghaiensis]
MLSPDNVRLILTGDVMTGRGIDQVLPCPGDPEIHEFYMRSARGYVALAEERNGGIPQPAPFDYLWGDALAAMAAREPNCRVINLETAVTRCNDFWPGKGINYRMHPGNIPCLTAARIAACSLANNHVLDWGYDGLAETLTSLHAAGVGTAGAGHDLQAAIKPAVIELGSRRILLFACGHYSSGIPADWAATETRAGVNFIGELSAQGAERIAQQVHAYRAPGNLTVVSIHWGGNWGYRIARQQREFAHRLIDAGVDLVHGHSSHHPQGIEVYRERAILYGCGDLINDYEGISGREEYRSHLRPLYCIDLDRDSGALQRLELIPLEMRRFRLQKPGEADCDWLRLTLDRECRHLGTKLRLAPVSESFLLDW